MLLMSVANVNISLPRNLFSTVEDVLFFFYPVRLGIQLYFRL